VDGHHRRGGGEMIFDDFFKEIRMPPPARFDCVNEAPMLRFSPHFPTSDFPESYTGSFEKS
jgi:hypothetical protein